MVNYIDKEPKNGWRFNFRDDKKIFFFSEDYEWIRNIVKILSSYDDEQRWYICYRLLFEVNEEYLCGIYEDFKFLDQIHNKAMGSEDKERLLQAIFYSWNEMSFTSAVAGSIADFLLRNSSSLSNRQAIQIILCVLHIALDNLQSLTEAKDYLNHQLTEFGNEIKKCG